MARPVKEGMDYFPHDVDSLSDEKIEVMRALYGNDGYAFYFIILERIYKTSSGTFDLSKNIVTATLIKKIGVSSELFYQMVETSLEIGLFDKEAYETSKILTSNGIQKRFQKVQIMRQKWCKKSKENENCNIISGDNYLENYELSPEKTPESKEKKRKEKERKVKESKIPYQELINLFNTTAISLPHVQELTNKRKREIKNIWSKPDRQNSDFWKNLFKKIESSDFLTGRKTEWKADFNWILQENNLCKILEGNYDNRYSQNIYKTASQKDPDEILNNFNQYFETVEV